MHTIDYYPRNVAHVPEFGCSLMRIHFHSALAVLHVPDLPNASLNVSPLLRSEGAIIATIHHTLHILATIPRVICPILLGHSLLWQIHEAEAVLHDPVPV
jgi:hypothetical protein